MYVKDNRDQLPWGVSPAWVSWMQALAETMGAAGSGLPKIAMCPDAENPHGIVRLHYSANPRAFSSRDFVNTSDPLTFWDPDLSTPPVKMSTIRPAAETGLIWDAPLFINGSHMSEEFEALPVNQFLDNYAYSNSWQHYMIRGRDTNVEQERVWGDPKTCNRDIALGKWDLWTWDDAKMHGFRYRHQGNTSLNMLFADGHVEGIRAGEVRRHHTFVSVRIMK